MIDSVRLFVVAPWDDSQHLIIRRYLPEHKAKIHQKIVEEASVRVRAVGLSGAALSAVMRDTGLTHGGFYKYFRSKDDLLVESLSEAFREFSDILVRAAEESPSGEAWKAIVKTYLRTEMCEHPEHGCPLAALAPELARVNKRVKPQIVTELVNYKSRMVPFMPGRRVFDKERALKLPDMTPSPCIGSLAFISNSWEVRKSCTGRLLVQFSSSSTVIAESNNVF